VATQETAHAAGGVAVIDVTELHGVAARGAPPLLLEDHGINLMSA
jgi:hypothetical protein